MGNNLLWYIMRKNYDFFLETKCCCNSLDHFLNVFIKNQDETKFLLLLLFCSFCTCLAAGSQEKVQPWQLFVLRSIIVRKLDMGPTSQ